MSDWRSMVALHGDGEYSYRHIRYHVNETQHVYCLEAICRWDKGRSFYVIMDDVCHEDLDQAHSAMIGIIDHYWLKLDRVRGYGHQDDGDVVTFRDVPIFINGPTHDGYLAVYTLYDRKGNPMIYRDSDHHRDALIQLLCERIDTALEFGEFPAPLG